VITPWNPNQNKIESPIPINQILKAKKEKKNIELKKNPGKLNKANLDGWSMLRRRPDQIVSNIKKKFSQDGSVLSNLFNLIQN